MTTMMNSRAITEHRASREIEVIDLYSSGDTNYSPDAEPKPLAQLAVVGREQMWYCDSEGGFMLAFIGNLVTTNNQPVITRTTIDIPADVVDLGKDSIVEYVREHKNILDPSVENGSLSGKDALLFLRRFSKVDNGLKILSKAVQEILGEESDYVELLSPLEQIKLVINSVGEKYQALEGVLESSGLGM